MYDIIRDFAYDITRRSLQRFTLDVLGLWRPLSRPGRGDECFCLMLLMEEEYRHTRAKVLTVSPIVAHWEDPRIVQGTHWRHMAKFAFAGANDTRNVFY